MKKLTKKLNNNTFVSGGSRFQRFRGAMKKARKSMKSGIITSARGIRTAGRGIRTAGRSLRRGMGTVRQKLYKPFKDTSIAKIGSRVEKRTKKLEGKTESYQTKIKGMDAKRTEYTQRIEDLKKLIEANPDKKATPYEERQLRETSDKLKRLATSQNQITAKLTKRKTELNTSKGKLNNYTTKLEKKATKKTNNAMDKYRKFGSKSKWARRFQRFTKSGKISRAINKGLKSKSITPEKMILDYQTYKGKRNGVMGNDGTVTEANPNAKMNHQKTIRDILADRKAKQMRFTSKRSRKRNNLVSYLKNSKTPSDILEKATKVTQEANSLITKTKEQTQKNKTLSENTKLLSKQSKNEKRLQALVNGNKSPRTWDEKRKMERALKRRILNNKKETRKDLKNKFDTLFSSEKSKEYNTLKEKEVKTPDEEKKLVELSKERKEALLKAIKEIREINLDKKRETYMKKTQEEIQKRDQLPMRGITLNQGQPTSLNQGQTTSLTQQNTSPNQGQPTSPTQQTTSLNSSEA